MGEYSEEYTLKNFGVDISVPEAKTKWKWRCEKCGKKLASKISHQQHMRDKHATQQLETRKEGARCQ
jgi:hypothetical protein